MRNITPGDYDPAHLDNAAVQVVEGLGGGVGGCDYAVDNVVNSSLASIDAGRPTITEISVQDIHYDADLGRYRGCSSDHQAWKNLFFQLVVRIEADPNARAWWGGIMLDEEDGFWTTDTQGNPESSVSAYEEINNSLAILMGNVFPYGISWYYTETFGSQGAWNLDAFTRITGLSQTAPQIANQPMADLVNQYQAATQHSTLVTWGFLPDYGFSGCPDPAGCTGFYQSEIRVTGPPYHSAAWNLDLSNCFSNTLHCDDWDADYVRNSMDNCMSVYNPDQANTDGNNAALNRPGGDALGDACDSDDDGDGYVDYAESAIGENPLDYCPIMRADVNSSGGATLSDLILVAGYYNVAVPPAPARYDQNAGETIGLADLIILGGAGVYGKNVSDCP